MSPSSRVREGLGGAVGEPRAGGGKTAPAVDLHRQAEPARGYAALDVIAGRPRGVGREPVHRWVVVTLTNNGAGARDVVVATPYQGFAGSVLFCPRSVGSRIQNVIAAGNGAIAPLRVVNSSIPPKPR